MKKIETLKSLTQGRWITAAAASGMALLAGCNPINNAIDSQFDANHLPGLEVSVPLTAASFTVSDPVVPNTIFGTSSSTVTYTVSNSGSSSGVFTGIAFTTATDFTLTGGSCTVGSTLTAGSSCTVTLIFSPTTTGVRSDLLTVGYSDSTAAKTATLTVSSTALTPASLSIAAGSFSNTTVGASSSATSFTVTNSGQASATISARSLTTGTQYSISGGTCAAAAVVAPAATCTLSVVFSPTSAGVKSDTLNLSYNNGVGAQTATRALSATGLTPAVLAIGAGSFSNTTVGATSGATTFTVTNSGGSTATISARSLTTGTQFAVSGGTCAAASTVVAAGTCTLTVTFSPTSAGLKSDTLNLSYNDGAAAQSATLAISGTGITPAVLAFNTQVFTAAMVSASSSKTFTATNSGGSVATISSQSLATGVDFAVTGGTCTVASSVAVGGTCTVIVTFTPTTSGTLSDTLQLGYFDGAGSQTASRAISAIGNPMLAVTPPSFSGNPAGASSTSADLTITNNGSASATNLTFSVAGTNFTLAPSGAPASGTACTSGLTLTAGQSCQLTATFSPLTPVVIDAGHGYNGGISATLTVGYKKSAISDSLTASVSGTAAPYQNGLGSSGSPYIVHTALQFYAIRDYNSAYFLQDANFDLGGFDGSNNPQTAFDPIPNFAGSYNGGNFTITGLYIDQRGTDHTALFSSMSDDVPFSVLNLTINEFYVSGGLESAVLVAVGNGIKLSNVHVQGTHNSTLYCSGGDTCGGLIGLWDSPNGNITGSSFAGTIDTVTFGGRENLGGLVGRITSSTDLTIIENSHSTGTLTPIRDYVGGLVGLIDNGGITVKTGSYSTMTISGEPVNKVGGLIGSIQGDGTRSIANSHYSGTIDARNQTVPGNAVREGDGGMNVGGLVGVLTEPTTLTITSSYSSGSITGIGENGGGLVGLGYAIDIVSSHSSATVSGINQIGGLVGYLQDRAPGPFSISRSYSTGRITASDHYAGGLIGWIDNDQLSLDKSYTSGVVNAGHFAGGIVGFAPHGGDYRRSYSQAEVNATDRHSGEAGGFAGLINRGTISDCYFVGSVFAPEGGDARTVAGFIYDDSRTTIAHSYSAPLDVSEINGHGGVAFSGLLAADDYGESFDVVVPHSNASGQVGHHLALENDHTFLDEGMYTSYSFEMSHDHWKMPLTNGTYPYLSAVLEWQCEDGGAGIVGHERGITCGH